jgi:hypothetical protein
MIKCSYTVSTLGLHTLSLCTVNSLSADSFTAETLWRLTFQKIKKKIKNSVEISKSLAQSMWSGPVGSQKVNIVLLSIISNYTFENGMTFLVKALLILELHFF